MKKLCYREKQKTSTLYLFLVFDTFVLECNIKRCLCILVSEFTTRGYGHPYTTNTPHGREFIVICLPSIGYSAKILELQTGSRVFECSSSKLWNIPLRFNSASGVEVSPPPRTRILLELSCKVCRMYAGEHVRGTFLLIYRALAAPP